MIRSSTARVHRTPSLALCALFAVLAAATSAPRVARADGWRLAAAGGAEAWASRTPGGNGFVLFDAQRSGVARGRLHLLYNTDTLQAGLEGIRLADGKLELSFIARGEALQAGLLFVYNQRGERVAGRGFSASYAELLPSLKWHPADRHSIELVLGARQWFFGRRSGTDAAFVLPPDTFVFAPRLRYTYWNVHADAREWEAHRYYPRITGVAFGLDLGLDRRTDRRAWGADVGGNLDPRNRPGDAILMARQWLYAGARLGSAARLQFEEHASWGRGEDDLTRNRIGGMNPYVIPIAGLPWAALLSERLVSGQASLHLRPSQRAAHELGVAVNGGAFSDIRRTGALGTYGGAGGLSLFADLRFGGWQVNARLGWAFPAPFQANPPHLSGLLTVGARIR